MGVATVELTLGLLLDLRSRGSPLGNCTWVLLTSSVQFLVRRTNSFLTYPLIGTFREFWTSVWHIWHIGYLVTLWSLIINLHFPRSVELTLGQGFGSGTVGVSVSTWVILGRKVLNTGKSEALLRLFVTAADTLWVRPFVSRSITALCLCRKSRSRMASNARSWMTWKSQEYSEPFNLIGKLTFPSTGTTSPLTVWTNGQGFSAIMSKNWFSLLLRNVLSLADTHAPVSTNTCALCTAIL